MPEQSMNDGSVVIALPVKPAPQLMLLFHGLGADADDLVPLGRRLARAYPQASVVSVQAPHACEFGAGRQWFSVRDVDDANRVQRVAAALPAFVEQVRRWQRDTGAGVAQTALIGFSQGAIMALHTTLSEPALAGRVISLSGRFAELPSRPAPRTTLHLLHGMRDAVIPATLARDAAEHLVAIGADVTADLLPGLGHGVDEALVERLLERLSTHVPAHTWREALASDPGQPDGELH
jgi:phospholipase/carboxylesterase